MHAWLIGTNVPVSVISNHKNLEYFMTSCILNRCQAHWSMFLSEFNFCLDYTPGSHNPADAPSQCADLAPQEGDTVLLEQCKTLITLVHMEHLAPHIKPTPLASAPSAPATPAASISSITSLAIDNSELLEHFKSATRMMLNGENSKQLALKTSKSMKTCCYTRAGSMSPRPYALRSSALAMMLSPLDTQAALAHSP